VVIKYIKNKRTVMEQNYLPDDPDTRRILNELQSLLTPLPPDGIDPASDTTVAFQLGSECYSIAATRVRTMYPLGTYTPLPLTHACIVGVVLSQGQRLVVVDIRPLLALPWVMPRPDDMLLQVILPEMEVGLLVNRVVAPTAGQVSQVDVPYSDTADRAYRT
jgi:chemotaxis signal transduction protein